MAVESMMNIYDKIELHLYHGKMTASGVTLLWHAAFPLFSGYSSSCEVPFPEI